MLTERDKGASSTYVGVSPDLLDGFFVEVAGIAGEAAADVVGVLQSSIDGIREGKLATLPQLELASLLAGSMDRVQPDVVVGGLVTVDVLLELDDVAVGNGLSLG